jgi:hypothetical protein
MSSAGLLKLLNSGLQDERLLPPKGQPLPFSKEYTRGGRFTTEWYRVEFDNRPAFNTVARATIPRRGHLITKAYLVTRMPDIRTPQQAARAWAAANGKTFAGPTFGWTNSIGHALIQNTQVLIGGNPIDSLDGRLLEILDEFHTPLEKVTTVNRLIGRYDSGFTPQKNGFQVQNQEVYTPLPFWFARGDPSAALPIDAIGTDPVQITVRFNYLNNLFVSTSRSVLPDGSQGMPSMLNSPFYYLDPTSGTQVAGLQGNPQKSQLVSQIPNITMPSSYTLPEAYLLLEYVYLDMPEANRIRLADIQYPISQTYAIQPTDTKGAPMTQIKMRIPNPTQEFYIHAHRKEAEHLNAPFLATRDLSGLFIPDASGIGPIAPWWPDASGLQLSGALMPLLPGYSGINSEPLSSLALSYEGRLVRYASDSPLFFSQILTAIEKRKTPWHNKYYYHLPFGTHSYHFGVTNPMGHANLDKIQSIDLQLTFQPNRGSVCLTDVPSYLIYVWAQSLNVLKVYGGRAGLLFGYNPGTIDSAETVTTTTDGQAAPCR